MELSEAIEHCREVANETDCVQCKIDHLQLADWLKELQGYRDEKQWHRDFSNQIRADVMRKPTPEALERNRKAKEALDKIRR